MGAKTLGSDSFSGQAKFTQLQYQEAIFVPWTVMAQVEFSVLLYNLMAHTYLKKKKKKHWVIINEHEDLPICVPTGEIHIQPINPIQVMLFLSYAEFL